MSVPIRAIIINHVTVVIGMTSSHILSDIESAVHIQTYNNTDQLFVLDHLRHFIGLTCHYWWIAGYWGGIMKIWLCLRIRKTPQNAVYPNTREASWMPHQATLYLILTFGGHCDHHMVLLYGVEAEWHSGKKYHNGGLKSIISTLTIYHNVIYYSDSCCTVAS